MKPLNNKAAEQPSAKTILLLEEAVAQVGIAYALSQFDGTRALDGDGLCTATKGDTSIAITDAAAYARADAVDAGTVFYVYNVVTRQCDRFTKVSCTAVGQLINTIEKVPSHYLGTDEKISLTPPWYDIYQIKLSTLFGSSPYAIVFSDIDPSALNLAGLLTFDFRHTEIVAAETAAGESHKLIKLPNSAMPCQCITLLNLVGAWNCVPFAPFGGTDYVSLSLHHKEVQASSTLVI